MKQDLSGFSYKERVHIINAQRQGETLARRYRILMERDREKAAREMWENDRNFYDSRFPLGAIPETIQDILQALGSKYGAPFGTSFAALLTMASGFLGTHKAALYRNARNTGDFFRPTLNCCLIGDSGSGKTPLADFALEPVRKFTADEINVFQKLKLQRGALSKELEKLNAIDEQEKTDEQKGRSRYIQHALELIEEGGAAYVAGFASPEGLIAKIYANQIRAEMQGRKQDGLIVTLEASRFFYRGTTASDTTNAVELYSSMNDLIDGKPDGKNAVTRKTQGKTDKIGVGCLFEIHPENFIALNSRPLVTTGFLNRFLYAFCPISRNVSNYDLDLTQAATVWREIIEYVHAFNGGAFYIGYSDALAEFEDETEKRVNTAIDAGDKPKSAFSRKLYYIVNQIALALHVLHLAIERRDLTREDETELFDGSTVPSWSVVSTLTFKRAAALACYYLETRDYIWSILQEETKPKRTTYTGERSAIMPPKTRRAYDCAIQNGAPFALLRDDDQPARAITLTELRTKLNCYQNAAIRAEIEADLIERGLLYIEAGKTQRRIFIPEDMTAEHIAEIPTAQEALQSHTEQEET